jgi:hypothetical protein
MRRDGGRCSAGVYASLIRAVVKLPTKGVMTEDNSVKPIVSHEDPPNDDPPPYPVPAGYIYPDGGTVVPPPSTYYPFSMQVSFSMYEGLLRWNGAPTISEPADYMSIWILLKTSNSPLMHGDTIQLQTYPDDATYGNWGANMIYTMSGPAPYGVAIWPYRETAILTDPRTRFSILRVDGAPAQIVGTTPVRLLSQSNGAYAKRHPPAVGPGGTGGYSFIFADGTSTDPDTVMNLIPLDTEEIKKRLSHPADTKRGVPDLNRVLRGSKSETD